MSKGLKQTGFTIVELLIVIVVIAILAAITIVTYSNIQTRARNTQTVSAANQYIKAISMYAAEKGSYPNAAGACLGTGYEYEGVAGRCGGSVTSLTEKAAFNTAIAEYMSGLPQLSTKNLQINSTNIRAGGYYDVLSGGTSARLYYILEGQQASCDAGGTKNATPGAPDMFCHYSFPAI